MFLQMEKEHIVRELLNVVMERIQNQLMVPAVYTLRKMNKTIEVHVFVHGSSASYLGNIDYIWEEISKFGEKTRQINALTDYFLAFFITEMKRQRELEAIAQVVQCLDLIYSQEVKAQTWFSKEKGQQMVTFTLPKSDIGITLTTDQLEQEFNSRFINEENIDILADLADLTKCLDENGLNETVKLAEKIGRNLMITQISSDWTTGTEFKARVFYSALDKPLEKSVGDFLEKEDSF